MAKDFIISKEDNPSVPNVKYIVKGVGTNIVSRELYKAGVNSTVQRNGGSKQDDALYSSILGTPVVADITFPAFEWTNQDNVTFNVPEIKLVTILIEVNKSKNIVKTPIQGLDGDIKEYISSGDHDITIKGKITGKNGVHPFQLVNDLNKLIEAPVSVKVISKFLQNLNIDTVVIESADLPQEEGGYSYQSFELRCVSDFAIELNIVSASNTTDGSLAMF